MVCEILGVEHDVQQDDPLRFKKLMDEMILFWARCHKAIRLLQ